MRPSSTSQQPPTSRHDPPATRATPARSIAGASPLTEQTGAAIGAGRRDILLRLRRIEGQARGIQDMVDNRCTHAEVVLQMRALEEATRSAVRALLLDHLDVCAASRDARVAARHLRDVLALMRRYVP